MADKCSKEASQPVTDWSSHQWIPVSHIALPGNSKSLPTFFPPSGSSMFLFLHLCAHQEELSKAKISLLLISVQTDSIILSLSVPVSKFLKRRKGNSPFLCLPLLKVRLGQGQRLCSLLEKPAWIAQHRDIGAADRMDHLPQHERRNKIFAKESQKTNEELAKVQPKVTLLINFALMVLGHRN